ncbi:extracellular solute-binding protein [Leadbettera azotonutricia]|uniref:Putative bacterial extracellular solute-binding protein n=1 Tax=Leadbettera azotonutricia (strain ATCC BAA-888 / DSM 13862 / ZAS-9) TaxID=545695 RepID=F5Y942_LEAAZ|nr:extracellular solute-binding protein [Leadbettera azotonutricia]AEF81732.1 putative bacterial extracellular solute-binding protein [Leadbettera azotonutricia ZAS-9]
MRHTRRFFLSFIILSVVLVALLGCQGKNRPSKRNPVGITVWHTYVEQMKTGFEELATEFNATRGAQEGITVSVTAVARAAVLNEKLLMAAEGDPGSPELPDIAVVYPPVAASLAQKGVLVDFASLFTREEISRYVGEFVEEGMIGGVFYLLPVAKSTEVLFLNKTIFDRFAADTPGVSLGQLATFEGIIAAAEQYREWSGGKTFYCPDELFNYTMIGMEQMGESFVQGKRLNVASPSFTRVWDSYYGPAARGEVAIFSNFGSQLALSGEVVAVSSTSAGAMYFPTSVTYADNSKEDVEFVVLPFPVFAGGEKVAAQRGGGMCVLKSTAAKEYGAGVFLKWLTEPAQNLRFTAATGYMPVMQEAFDLVMANGMDAVGEGLKRQAFLAAIAMQKEYRFFIPPVFDGLDTLQTRYVEELQKAAKRGLSGGESGEDLRSFIAAFSE